MMRTNYSAGPAVDRNEIPLQSHRRRMETNNGHRRRAETPMGHRIRPATWKRLLEPFKKVVSDEEFLRDPSSGEESPAKPGLTLDGLKGALLDADEMLTMKFPPKKRILHPWLTEQSLTLISGWRGIGKTWFGLGLADSISRGVALGPWKVITPVPILYIDGEMDIQEIQKRLRTLKEGSNEKRKAPIKIYSDYYGNSKGLSKANLSSQEWRDGIKAVALENKIKLLMLDNLSSLCPGIDENSKLEWDPINQWLIGLRFAGLSSILFHHTGRKGEQRGTSGREDNIDISISLAKATNYKPGDSPRFIPKFTKVRVKVTERALLKDQLFELKGIKGAAVWEVSGQKKKKKNKGGVLRLISEGKPQNEIAKQSGLSVGRVSQLKKEFIKDGWLTKKGQITGKGEEFLAES